MSTQVHLCICICWV